MRDSLIDHLIRDRRLILLPAFGGLILCSRFLSTNSLFYAFLIWNIFLATIPLFLAFCLPLFKRNSLPGLGLLLVWLLFLPNSFYIITDFKHLAASRPDWILFDSVMLFCFAIGGIYLGVKSVLIVKQQWRVALNKTQLNIALGLLFLACGFGIYLGRVLRWNSWDALQHPQELLSDIVARILNPVQYSQTWIFTLIYAAFIALSYVFFSRLIKSDHE